MRISELFNLGRSQGALDFVDVDTSADVPVFIDPRAVRKQQGDWGDNCRDFLDTHFEEVIHALTTDDRTRIHELMATGEPNETHLGWSTGKTSRGHGTRQVIADEIANTLAESSAAQAGMLLNIEDVMLLVPDIGPDLISDQATHILRGPLIGYTQSWCRFLNIPMQRQDAGIIWHPANRAWDRALTDLPRTEYGPLLLVPRSFVRYHVSTDTDRYYNGYLAPLLENHEIDYRTAIVRRYKNGRHYVPRPDLHKKYPQDKAAIVEHTIEHSQALTAYRDSSNVERRYPPLDHIELTERTKAPSPHFMDLYDSIAAVLPGQGGAHAYHLAVEALLTAIFYPALANATVEREIHEGRKRIDITYDNVATTGLFSWMRHWPCARIVVECKNYSRDPANEALDQISGRFSTDRGQIGLLVARAFEDRDLFLRRCRDTAKDGRGWIIPLDDDDLHALATEAESSFAVPRSERLEFRVIRQKFDQLLS